MEGKMLARKVATDSPTSLTPNIFLAGKVSTWMQSRMQTWSIFIFHIDAEVDRGKNYNRKLQFFVAIQGWVTL